MHHTGQRALVTLLGASINALPVAVASMGALVVSAFSSERYFEIPQADAVTKASSWAFLPRFASSAASLLKTTHPAPAESNIRYISRQALLPGMPDGR